MTPARIMDPTNSTAETSNTTTNMEMNGHDNANENLEGSANLSATTNQNNQTHNTYDALFPQLPGKAASSHPADGNPMGTKWGSKPMIISPTVTQVSLIFWVFLLNPRSRTTTLYLMIEIILSFY